MEVSKEHMASEANMADETNNNEATELVGDHVETVDVSKHPDPSIPVTDLSLADIERRQSHPVPWAVFIVAVLAAIIAPYWLGRSLAESRNWLCRIVFVVGLAAEQFIAGLSLLKLNFWYSTYVVYGDSAQLPNAANLGIIAAGVGVAVYAVVWVGLLILIKKDSPLNVLTRSWASFILFFAIETAALLIVLFGGLLTAV